MHQAKASVRTGGFWNVPAALRWLPLAAPLHLVRPHHRLLALLLLQRRLAELLKYILGGLHSVWSDWLLHQLCPRLGVVQDDALQEGGKQAFTDAASAGK